MINYNNKIFKPVSISENAEVSENTQFVYKQTGNTEKILTVGQSVGDIAYIKDKQLLLLPMNRQSRLLFYRLK